MFAASLYECVLAVYFFLAFAVILLKVWAGTSEITNTRTLFRAAFRYLLPLAVGVVMEAGVSQALMSLFHIAPSANAMNSVSCFNIGIGVCITQLLQGYAYKNMIMALVYLPIAVLLFSMLALLVYGVVDMLKRRRLYLVWIYLALMLSILLMSLIQGAPSPYRAQFVNPFFIGFVGLLLVQQSQKLKSNTWRGIVLCCAALLVFYQANDLNHWFALDARRYETEHDAIVQIGYALRRDYDLSEPVAFVGDYSANLGSEHDRNAKVTDSGTIAVINRLRAIVGLDAVDSIDVQETNNKSYIKWSTFAWGDRSDLVKFFRALRV